MSYSLYEPQQDAIAISVNPQRPRLANFVIDECCGVNYPFTLYSGFSRTTKIGFFAEVIFASHKFSWHPPFNEIIPKLSFSSSLTYSLLMYLHPRSKLLWISLTSCNVKIHDLEDQIELDICAICDWCSYGSSRLYFFSYITPYFVWLCLYLFALADLYFHVIILCFQLICLHN